MLPAHIAQNIRKQIRYYLQSTFSFRDRRVDKAFEDFLEDPENGIFKGPWVQLQRPFRLAPRGVATPFDIQFPFQPYLHQYRAWSRLSAKNGRARNTIITTGTGSGKTECFMFPILDHCLRARKMGRKGIKAIILYPMNALAADQEKRFAAAIWRDSLLKKAGLRVGNYTGRYDPANPGKSETSGSMGMGPDHGITNHAAQQENPPDILLTNYRMLDFLLMRPQDQRLWRHNDPGTLKYLALDELHTYDGAQGADVACLIRRLKERLGAARGDLCVVGTSATLDDRERPEEIRGDGSADAAEVGVDRLAAFAETLFEEEIPVEAVIGEERLSVEQIVLPDPVETDLPDPDDCRPGEGEDALAYVSRQSRCWGGPLWEGPGNGGGDAAVERWEIALGEWLKGTRLFKYLLEVFHAAELNGEDPLPWSELVKRLTRKDFGLRRTAGEDERSLLIASFYSLAARAREMRGERSSALTPTRAQLWIRELRRLGRRVSRAPVFTWLDEPEIGFKSLPALHCSECGESGWAALQNPDMDARINSKEVSGWAMESDPAKIYRAWFGAGSRRDGGARKSQYIFVISPRGDGRSGHPREAGEKAPEQMALTSMDARDFYFHPGSLVIRRGEGPCPLTGENRGFRVRVNNKNRTLQNGQVMGDQRCPRCGAAEGLFFVGAQSATLSSVAIDEMFGSILNSDPKLLAFTDSVQDASHRAGFFTARTYHFTFRTALQHVINYHAAGKDGARAGLRLTEAGSRLFEYWSRKRPGRPGSVRETMTALMPTDLQEYPPFRAFRNNPDMEKPPGALLDEVTRRLTWQAISEFGLMQTHGRTMELNGSACLQWDEAVMDETLTRLKEKLPGVNPVFAGIDDGRLRLWIHGVLHRCRERGALSHPYLEAYARKNFWGKYPFGRAIEGRETFPPALRYKPRLLSTTPRRNHEYMLAGSRGGKPPWHIRWAYRALGEPAALEADMLDLIRAWLAAGREAGLLTRLHQDGDAALYAISSRAAALTPGGVRLACEETGRFIVRPETEARAWKNAPSMEYYAERGRYGIRSFNARQRYYQDRYNKGALRRVTAEEHTGLLAAEERERVESCFKQGKHADDPNVLACTSTLEMGIDIGDLSSAMLCSIPPTTASYLQRIGRAGRAAGTALIVSLINQRPHDLFFYARPMEMLKGKVDSPGCWLDASAVLVRQYLGFCFDCAAHEGALTEIPRRGRRLVEDLKKPDGHIPAMMAWVADHEEELRHRFLKRYRTTTQQDTLERFTHEADARLLLQKIHQAARDFDQSRRVLENARNRLNDQLEQLDEEEHETRIEILRETRILKGRLAGLDRAGALELLTDFGLLPNYAFPERGVRFHGAVYNKHQHVDQEYTPVELRRNGAAAIRELAPGAVFYTHRRQFDIQQIAIGASRQLLTETWAICGACGHMRPMEDLNRPDADPACPQCGHSAGRGSQLEIGQRRQFIEFAQSQAISYMEHYKSLSGDRDEERQRGFYEVVTSFDQTRERSAGAVGDDGLPFGIEYRSSMIMREVNTGYAADQKELPFGPGVFAPEAGFTICRHCGVAQPPDRTGDAVGPGAHRRSCVGLRKYEKMRQEGKEAPGALAYIHVYLYRQLKSEAIRLLLPLVDDEDIDTLAACIHLGLRLRFEGNPAHLLVQPQIIPESTTGLARHYLALMDSVPGGTGFLKTLYQEKDDMGREGEGVMDALRRARNALETCQCGRLAQREDSENPDGCYRCIRTYHLQYKAERISRRRGIDLLNRLIAAGEKRVPKRELSRIRPDSLFGSLLEKKFVDALRAFVRGRDGAWTDALIKGARGFRFSLPDSDRQWELELQPSLGPAQGVNIPSQPDFLLACDDEAVAPAAIFTDGFEFHCRPHNRLADDMEKRRAIIESGNYRVWSVAWDDLTDEDQAGPMVCHDMLAVYLEKYRPRIARKHADVPDARQCVANGMEQLKGYISAPGRAGWKQMAEYLVFYPLMMLAGRRKVPHTGLRAAVEQWREGGPMRQLANDENGDWVYNERVSLNGDFVAYITNEDISTFATEKAGVIGRLGDGEEETADGGFKERWRRFLACVNVFQFTGDFTFWAASEARDGAAPGVVFEGRYKISGEWKGVFDDTVPSLRPVVEALARAGLPAPVVEYENEDIEDDAFAELAWADSKPGIAVLVGDQRSFAPEWRRQGWKVISREEIEAEGVEWLIAVVGGEER